MFEKADLEKRLREEIEGLEYVVYAMFKKGLTKPLPRASNLTTNPQLTSQRSIGRRSYKRS